MTDNYYECGAELPCGATINLVQQHQHGLITVTITPPTNVPVADVGKIKDGKIVINATVEGLAGVYKMLQYMAGDIRPKQKNWWTW